MTLNKVKLKAFGKKHGPKVLIAFGIVEMISAIGYAIKKTPEAMENISKLRNDPNREIDKELELLHKADPEHVVGEPVPLTKKEIISCTWRCYVPTAIFAAASIGSFIGATSIYWKESTALAAVYEVSKKALDEYKDYRKEVVSEIGEEAEQKISEKVSQKQVERSPKTETKQVTVVGNGDILFHESLTGQRFRSSVQEVKRVVNELNHRMLHENYILLNDWLVCLGLEPVATGDRMGWSSMENGLIEYTLDAVVINDEPSLYINYDTIPDII